MDTENIIQKLACFVRLWLFQLRYSKRKSAEEINTFDFAPGPWWTASLENKIGDNIYIDMAGYTLQLLPITATIYTIQDEQIFKYQG